MFIEQHRSTLAHMRSSCVSSRWWMRSRGATELVRSVRDSGDAIVELRSSYLRERAVESVSGRSGRPPYLALRRCAMEHVLRLQSSRVARQGDELNVGRGPHRNPCCGSSRGSTRSTRSSRGSIRSSSSITCSSCNAACSYGSATRR